MQGASTPLHDDNLVWLCNYIVLQGATTPLHDDVRDSTKQFLHRCARSERPVAWRRRSVLSCVLTPSCKGRTPRCMTTYVFGCVLTTSPREERTPRCVATLKCFRLCTYIVMQGANAPLQDAVLRRLYHFIVVQGANTPLHDDVRASTEQFLHRHARSERPVA